MVRFGKCGKFGCKNKAVMYGVLEYNNNKYSVQVCSKSHLTEIKNNLGDPDNSHYKKYKKGNKIYLENASSETILQKLLKSTNVSNNIKNKGNSKKKSKKNPNKKKKKKSKKSPGIFGFFR